jgi:CDP-paratose 2-epimerase
MRILITGICGFVGSRLAEELLARIPGLEIIGIDNLSRRGGELNLPRLKRLGCRVVHADIRLADDLAELEAVDWVVDCAANPTVLAGLTGGTAQLVANNLVGTLHILEKCRRDGAGLVILSTSRVYSIPALTAIPLVTRDSRFELDPVAALPSGLTAAGVTEAFSTTAPVSLYGATKLASEQMALEYGYTFRLPVRINRCGVIAGPGQFGRIDQGIFSYWIYRWIEARPLSYIGFGGTGLQVRDLVSPGDLAGLVALQLQKPDGAAPPVLNIGGGRERSLSLQELSRFCASELGPGPRLGAVPETRPFDIPYYVTDSSAAAAHWGWRPEERAEETLRAIGRWANEHRDHLASFE